MRSEIKNELKRGGSWLGAARAWMQSNIKDGDRLCWSSTETVSVRFCDLEELALEAATAAVAKERRDGAG